MAAIGGVVRGLERWRSNARIIYVWQSASASIERREIDLWQGDHSKTQGPGFCKVKLVAAAGFVTVNSIMLSSVSVGEGLKTRPTPSPSVDAPKTPNCANKDARDASAAVEALEASLEACLKSAAALGGAAPTGAAARLAAKADAHGVARRGRCCGRPRPAVVDFIYCAGGPRRDVV